MPNAYDRARFLMFPHSGAVTGEDRQAVAILAGHIYIGDCLEAGLRYVIETLAEKVEKGSKMELLKNWSPRLCDELRDLGLCACDRLEEIDNAKAEVVSRETHSALLRVATDRIQELKEENAKLRGGDEDGKLEHGPRQWREGCSETMYAG